MNDLAKIRARSVVVHARFCQALRSNIDQMRAMRQQMVAQQDHWRAEQVKGRRDARHELWRLAV